MKVRNSLIGKTLVSKEFRTFWLYSSQMSVRRRDSSPTLEYRLCGLTQTFSLLDSKSKTTFRWFVRWNDDCMNGMRASTKSFQLFISVIVDNEFIIFCSLIQINWEDVVILQRRYWCLITRWVATTCRIHIVLTAPGVPVSRPVSSVIIVDSNFNFRISRGAS